MADTDDLMPNYYRLHRDAWEAVNATLPPIQAAKVLYAIERLFFEGVEPEPGSLPKSAQGLFNIQRQLVLGYRRNALNGSKSQKPTQKPNKKTAQEPTKKPTQETGQVFEGPDGALPAETQKVGGKPSGKGAGNNIKQETINIVPVAAALLPRAEQGGGVSEPNEPDRNSSVLEGTEPPRATAGAAMERPAAALASWAELMGRNRRQAPSGPVPPEAEWRRVARILETQGLDALTESDRATYSAGHKAYAPNGAVAEP